MHGMTWSGIREIRVADFLHLAGVLPIFLPRSRMARAHPIRHGLHGFAAGDSLFDQLGCSCDDAGRQVEAKRLGGSKIDHQLEVGR